MPSNLDPNPRCYAFVFVFADDDRPYGLIVDGLLPALRVDARHGAVRARQVAGKCSISQLCADSDVLLRVLPLPLSPSSALLASTPTLPAYRQRPCVLPSLRVLDSTREPNPVSIIRRAQNCNALNMFCSRFAGEGRPDLPGPRLAAHRGDRGRRVPQRQDRL
jgi:hypothetical protein